MFAAKRSFPAFIALVFALSGAAVILPAVPANAATATTISESVAPSVITYGAAQTITGHLATASTHANLAALGVTLQRRLNGTTTWRNWLVVKTNPTGYYKVTYSPSRSYSYRARFGGTSRFGPAMSAIRLGTVRPRVTAVLSPSGRSLTVGQVATFTGTVVPHLSTQRVLVLEAVSGKWLNVASTTPNAASKYSLAWRPTKAGQHTYRLLVTSGTALAPAYPASAAITAFRWLWLSDLPLVDSLNIDYINKGSMSINGATYPHSIWIRVENRYNMWGEWNLARKCTTLDATVGIGDTSASGTAGGLDAYSDDTLISSKVQQLATSARVTTPLLGGLRLRLQGIYTGSTGITRVTWGNARILCSF